MLISFVVKKEPVPVPEVMVAHIYTQEGDGHIYSFEALWADALTTGYAVDDYSGNELITAANGPSTFLVARAFMEFDLSDFASEGRTIQSIALDIPGHGFEESTVQIQQGTFSAAVSSGDLQLSDFTAFTGDMFLDTPFTWELWDGGDVNHNVITLNTAGQSYIESAFEGSAKLCIRDAPYDIGNVEPSVDHRCGGYYWEDGNNLTPNVRTPKLIINYLKFADWSSHLDNVDWTTEGEGTWDGAKWSSTNDEVWLSANAFATDYVPYKIRITFTGVETLSWVELYNTDESDNLFEGRETIVSGVAYEINSYNNYDLSYIDLFGSGPFNVTNIEFLER